jgi:hypothetical protein
MATRMTPEDRLTALAEALAERDGVALGSGRRGFGADALQVGGRIFAMVSHERLVFKLPAGRVAELIAAGDGVPFDAGKGRAMKEWVAFEKLPTTARSLALATEACDFVGGAPVPANAEKSASAKKTAKASVGTDAQARRTFDELAAVMTGDAGTTRKGFFGADGLRTEAGFFAFLTRDDRLALKLPPATRQELIAAGRAETAESVSPSMRRAWVLLVADAGDARRWRALATEARDFVRANSRSAQ